MDETYQASPKAHTPHFTKKLIEHSNLYEWMKRTRQVPRLKLADIDFSDFANLGILAEHFALQVVVDEFFIGWVESVSHRHRLHSCPAHHLLLTSTSPQQQKIENREPQEEQVTERCICIYVWFFGNIFFRLRISRGGVLGGVVKREKPIYSVMH
jgi:hypothetical protein